LKIIIKKLDDGLAVLKYKGQKHEVWVNEVLKEELWLCSDICLKDEMNLTEFSKMMESFRKKTGPTTYDLAPEYLALEEQGYRLKTVKYHNEGEKSVTELIRLEKKQLPEKEFNIPDGYRKVKIAELYY